MEADQKQETVDRLCVIFMLMEPQITEDLCAAQQPKVFEGLVKELCFLMLKEEDQEKVLLQLSQAETDDRQMAKEPLVFCLQIKDDMDIFLNEFLDKNSLVINRMFMEIFFFFLRFNLSSCTCCSIYTQFGLIL